MGELFNTIFYQPIFNLLIGIYNVLPGKDIGLAIIVLTIIVKAVLWPLTTKALKSQKELQELQPKMEALKKQFASDKEKLGKELMDLYSREKVSPFSSCLPLLLQLPVFIALYKALANGLKSSGFDVLYSFVPNPGQIAPMLFSVIDLSKPNIPVTILAAITQYFQARSMVSRQQPKVAGSDDERMMVMVNKQMTIMMPIMTLIMGWTLPGGLILYWLVMNLLTIAQQEWFFRRGKAAKPETVKL
ncbi:MAG: YidC/Oxa1 family membrane protein insertase [Patescibacteria group bacterium]|nr:YidC/Oxa1 family membrane protein insertase [Patescibacteria group bacterium]